MFTELDGLKSKKDLKGALALLDKYLGRFSADDRLWYQKGVILGDTEDFAGAFHCLSRAITINKNSEAGPLLKKLQGQHEKLAEKRHVVTVTPFPC